MPQICGFVRKIPTESNIGSLCSDTLMKCLVWSCVTWSAL